MDGDTTSKPASDRARPDLREAILQASLQLGTEIGEEGVTMRAIAARLGVSATALYQHFDGKSAILRAIRFYGFDLLEARLEPAHRDPDPVERLRAECIGYIHFARENPWLYRLLFVEEQLDWTKFSVSERERINAMHMRTRKAFDDAIESGRFRQDLAGITGPLLMWAANHGLASLLLGGRISERHPAFPVHDEQAFLHAFVDSILRGFG
jgi:AcrR family transcriptional regulator